MANIDKYLTVRNNSLIAVSPLKIVLNKSDFKNNIAIDVNDTVETFGIFKVHSLDSTDVFDVSFPIIINLNISERKEDKDFVTLIYQANDIIIERMTYIDGPKQANRFLDLLIGGKFLDKTQEELVIMFTTNMGLNGANVGVQSELIEAMVSELVRWEKDNSIPFRMKSGKVPDDQYTFLSIKDVARTSSVFNTLSFEDVKKSIQSSILMSRNNTKQRTSPIEKSVLY